MEIEVTEKRTNPLLNRTEVRFRVAHLGAATPKRDDVRDKLAATLNSKKDLVVIDAMESSFGLGETAGYARVYENVDSMGKIERRFLLKRNGLEKYAPVKKERTEAPAAAKPAAKPRKGR
ncbi:MAG: 30S ribosomal protein S24e [Thermoplasmatota archaeon]